MELGIRDSFLGHLCTLERLQDSIIHHLEELLSPAYYNSNLPSLIKRPTSSSSSSSSLLAPPPGMGGMAGAGVMGGASSSSSSSLADDSLQRSIRLKSFVNKWKTELSQFKEKIETSDSFQSTHFQEMFQFIEDSKNNRVPPLLTAPEIKVIGSVSSSSGGGYAGGRSKIITSRLDFCHTLFQEMITNGRELCNYQWTITEAACDTIQILIESLLKMFYRDLCASSTTVKKYYDSKLAVDVKKFQTYVNHQKEQALSHQAASYRDMGRSIKMQTNVFRDMIKCLGEEFDHLPESRRAKARKRLDELNKRIQEIITQADVYYEASHKIVLPQSLSTVYYRSIRNWLHDYQLLLIETITVILKSNAEGGSAPLPPGWSGGAGGSGGSSSSSSLLGVRRTIDTKAGSALYNYVKRMDSSRFLSLATSEALSKPSSACVNEILLGFAQFHQNSNKQNLTTLKASIDKLTAQYASLDTHVREMVKTQQQLYSAVATAVPAPRSASGSGGGVPGAGAGATARGVGTAGATAVGATAGAIASGVTGRLPTITMAGSTSLGLASPEVLKRIDQLDESIKQSEAQLQSMYHTIFDTMGSDYTKLEQTNQRLVEIVDYLKNYAAIMREWEEKIKQEQLFIQRWKEMRKFNSRYISSQFMEWNYFITEEMDVFSQTLGLFSASIFHQIKNTVTDFISMINNTNCARTELLNTDMNRILKASDDVRREEGNSILTGTASSSSSAGQESESMADGIIRVKDKISDWIDRSTRLYHAYFDYRLKGVIVYYISALESLFDKFDDENSELAVLLKTFDSMFELSADDVEEERENRRYSSTMNKLRIF